VLLNRSLAINYYVTASTDMGCNVMDEKGLRVDNNNVTESSCFDVKAKLGNASFATVKLGSTYDWSKPVAVNDTIRTLNVTSKTTPVGSFKASFESESGKSSAGFDISAMMYFLSVEFPRWDGYTVYNDPEVGFPVCKGNFAAPPEPTPDAALAQNWLIFVAIGAVATVAVVFRNKIKHVFSHLRKTQEVKPAPHGPSPTP